MIGIIKFIITFKLKFVATIFTFVLLLGIMVQHSCIVSAQTQIVTRPTASLSTTPTTDTTIATMAAYLSSSVIHQPPSFRRTLPKSNVFTLPFKNIGTLIRVQATVNGRKGYFILDSGAPFLVLNSHYFPNLGSELRFVSVGGITGNVDNVRTAVVDSFEWGGIKHTSLHCHIVDLKHLERQPTDSILGLIGFEIFRDLEMLMDYDASRIVLYQLTPDGDRIEYDVDYQTPEYTVPFTYHAHLPIVEASIAGKTLRFGIDTGAEFNLLSHSVDSIILRSFIRDKKISIRGSGKSTLEAWLGRIEDMTLGCKALYISQTTLLADIQETNDTFGTKLSGLLGQPFLRYRRTVINFRKKELYLWDFGY